LNEVNIISDQEPATQGLCSNCAEPIAIVSRFCRHCGHAQDDNSVIPHDQKWSNIKQVGLFFLFDAVICCIASFIPYFKTLAWSIAFDTTLVAIAVTFFCDNWSKNKSLLKWTNFSLLKLISFCAIAVFSSVIVSFLVRQLNQSLFSKEFSYYAFYSQYAYGKALMIFFVAVMPALFEELAYRGFLLQKLLQLVDKKQAIFISAFFFAIMHMSFISLFWLLPFALILGFVRVKENTIWYGVFIHFSFNLTACLLELL
jgi:membrane protease YdiL (CAAX protease family)